MFWREHWRRVVVWVVGVILVLGVAGFGGSLWMASGQILKPSYRGATGDLSVCAAETAKYLGKDCGNLRETHQFVFSEVKIPALNGYNLPGWLVKTTDNGREPARGAIMLAHVGGADRRQDTKYIQYYLDQGLDVLTFDQSCQGEAPCAVKGMTYGERESRDVFSAYLYLTGKYERVYAMGSSVGASAILDALPQMPQLAGVIAENPMMSLERLIGEAPQAQAMPAWFSQVMVGLAKYRGRFDTLLSPEHSLPLVKTIPIFFIHSKQDTTVSYKQTEELVRLYNGPKTVWIVDKGEHAEIWDEDHAAYEAKVTNFLNSTP